MNKNFWKADSKPMARSQRSSTSYTPKLSRYHQLNRYRQFIWNNAKWLLALLLVTGVVGIILYAFEIEHRLQAEHATAQSTEVEDLLPNTHSNSTIDHLHNTVHYNRINQTRGQYTNSNSYINNNNNNNQINSNNNDYSNQRPVGGDADSGNIRGSDTTVRFSNSGGRQSIFDRDPDETPVVTILPAVTKRTSTSTVRAIKETDFNANSNHANGGDWHDRVNIDSVVVISPQPKPTPNKKTDPTFVPKYTVSVTSTVSSTTSTSAAKLPHTPDQRNAINILTDGDANAAIDGPPVDDDDRLAINRDRPLRVMYPSKETLQNFGFTSGHQNNFGVPIEEDERILRMLNAQLAAEQRQPLNDNEFLSTTDLSVYRTRVSPTLPILKKLDATTEAFGRGKKNGPDGLYLV